jgi:hypothetical protein
VSRSLQRELAQKSLPLHSGINWDGFNKIDEEQMSAQISQFYRHELT